MVIDGTFSSLYVVIGIVFITWVSVVLYLIRLERKISHLEQQLRERRSHDET